MGLISSAQVAVKRAFSKILYRYPPFALQPERLATYLGGLLQRRHLPGDIGEIGCNLGGTAAIAFRMLRRQGWTHDYICYDTFGGFVDEQFDIDQSLGTPTGHRSMFSANSVELVRKVLRQHGAEGVKLVPGDITKVADAKLSDAYSAILLDIDLSEPTYLALKRFWPRVVEGGIIYVDDCPEGSTWKAKVGYVRFCQEMGLPESYEFGFGVLRR